MLTSDSKIKQKRRISIRLKLMLMVIPIVVASTLITNSIMFNRSYDIIYDQQYELLISKNKLKVDNVRRFTTEVISKLDTIRSTINHVKFTDEELVNYLNSNNSDIYAGDIYIGDSNNKYIDSSGWTPPEGYEVTTKPWFIIGKERERVGFTSTYKNEQTGNMVVSAVTTVHKGLATTVLSADINLGKVQNILTSSDHTEFTFIIDKNTGVVIAEDNKNTLDSNIKELLIKQASDTKVDANSSATVDVTNSNTDIGTENSNDILTEFSISKEEIKEVNWVVVSCVKLDDLNKQARELKVNSMIVSVICLVILITAIELMGYKLTKSITKVNDILTHMASGNLNCELEVTGNDELTDVSLKVNFFIGKMNDIVKSISREAKNVLDQSILSKENSKQMLESSKSQYEAMVQLSVTVEELAKSVMEIAGNASYLANIVSDTNNKGNNVKDLIEKTVETSNQGKTEMRTVATSILDLQTTIINLEEVVKGVGDRNTEIASITNMIEDMAKQIKLLGLNASIEAARIGENGKGFAIVAQEIQKLANTSSQAVKDIKVIVKNTTDIVTNTEDKTKSAVNSVKTCHNDILKTVDTFENIYKYVGLSGEEVENIIKSIKNIDEISISVASITEEQSASAEEILATSENVANQSNLLVDKSKELEKSAEELDNMALQLKESIQGIQV